MFRLFATRRRWRVHICATTPDQRPYLDALTRWLKANGHRILAAPDAPLAERAAAARACEVCLLVLGPEYGAREPHASFSATELEAYAALEGDANKLLIFSQPDADHTTSVEQREFIARMRDFTGGTFQATVAAPDRLAGELQAALARMEAAHAASRNLTRAVMISSTGDLVLERTRLRDLLTSLRHPVIDYQTAASETATPIERVTAWAGQCRALVLILGQRYGFISPVDGLGVTELEFVTALGSCRPTLALIRPDALTTDDPDQRQFLARVRHFLTADRIRLCPTLDDLEREARDGLRALLASSGAKPTPMPAIPQEQARAWYQRQVERWLGTLPHARNPAGMALTSMPLLLAPEPVDADTLLATTDNAMSHFAPETLAGVAATTVEDALAGAPRLVIAGPAGAGKTVILRWYALGAAAAGERIPVLISLPDYGRARRAGLCASLLDYAEREERRMLLAAPSEPSRWRAALEAGRGLLLLDGWSDLDGAGQRTIADDIAACAAALPPETPIVLAQREAPATPLAGFTPRYILPLSLAQQSEIARRWLETAQPVEGLSDERMRERFANITFQMRSLSALTSWARTPLLLTTLITVLDSMEEQTFGMLGGSGAVLLRRVLRLLLTLDRRPRALWEKERLLLELARRTIDAPPEPVIPAGALRAAWQAVAPDGDGGDPDATPRGLIPLLAPTLGGWRYAHAMFAAVYAASALAERSAAARQDYIARHRLYTAWNHVPVLLPGELDRLRHSAEGDAAVEALLRGDTSPVAGSDYTDPFHFALYTAAAAQGARAPEHARGGPGPEIAHRLASLASDLETFKGQDDAVDQVTWSLLLLGPAAEGALETLIALIDTPRSTAAAALRALARRGVERARAAIEEYDASNPRDPTTRTNAATQIGALRARARGGDTTERWWSALRLCGFGPLAASAVPEMTALLASDEWMARRYSAEALTAIGPAAAPALPELLRLALDDEVGQVEFEAQRTLTRLAAFITPAMARVAGERLDAEDSKARLRAIRTMGALGAVASPYAARLIATALGHADGLEDMTAGQALATLGPGAIAQANAAIVAAIHSEDWQERRQALRMVSALKAHAAPLLEPLRACVRDAAYPDRREAVTALGYLGAAAAPALDDMRALLTDRDLRVDALLALGELGPLARPLLEDALALWDDPDPWVRTRVYDALKGLNPPVTPRIEAILLRALDDEHPGVRAQVSFTASLLRPATPAVAAALLRRYATADADPQAWSARYDLKRCEQSLWDAGGLSG